jgi:hypothetical protein
MVYSFQINFLPFLHSSILKNLNDDDIGIGSGLSILSVLIQHTIRIIEGSCKQDTQTATADDCKDEYCFHDLHEEERKESNQFYVEINR